MHIATSWSTATGTQAAFDEAIARLLARLGHPPDYVMIYFTENYSAEELLAALTVLPPSVKIQGCTSCLGVMTEEGLHSEDGRALAMLGVRDAGGAYGVGAAPMGNDSRAAASTALQAALADSGRPGELPEIIRVNASPGREEDVLKGISDLVGTNVPVLGGSAADNQIAGGWQLLTRAYHASGDIVKKSGSGWLHYKRTNALNGVVEMKKVYVTKVPAYDGFVGSGFLQPFENK